MGGGRFPNAMLLDGYLGCDTPQLQMPSKRVTRIDALFDIVREINGLDADARLGARQTLSRPLVEDLHEWLLPERARMSRHNPVVKAIN